MDVLPSVWVEISCRFDVWSTWNFSQWHSKLYKLPNNFQLVSSVQSLSRVQLFATPRTAARQASFSITNSRSLLKLMSIESVMLSNYLILCRPLLLPLSVFPSFRVFFQWVSSSHQVAKVLEFQLQHQSFQWTPRTDLLWSPCCPRDSQESSSSPQLDKT